MSRRVRLSLLGLLGLLALSAFAFWLLVPRHRVAPVTVSSVTRPSGQVAVRFAAPEDLRALRERLRVGFVVAVLFACDDRETSTREVVTQGAEYFGDRGRVTRLEPIDDRGSQYLATFEPALARTEDDGRIRFIPVAAATGGLCFALEGGNMFFGRIWSDPVRLPPLR